MKARNRTIAITLEPHRLSPQGHSVWVLQATARCIIKETPFFVLPYKQSGEKHNGITGFIDTDDE